MGCDHGEPPAGDGVRPDRGEDVRSRRRGGDARQRRNPEGEHAEGVGRGERRTWARLALPGSAISAWRDLAAPSRY